MGGSHLLLSIDNLNLIKTVIQELKGNLL